MSEEPDYLDVLSRSLRKLVEKKFGAKCRVDEVALQAQLSRNTVSSALHARRGSKVPADRTIRSFAEATEAVHQLKSLESLREQALEQARSLPSAPPGSPLWPEFVTPPKGLVDDLLVTDFAYGVLEPLARGFVGRGTYVDAVLDAVDDPTFPSGYILITGEPGIGKTSLMAHLVRSRKWLHHFNIAASGAATTAAFLRNVCAQLVIRHKLGHAALPSRAGQDSLFLLGLLGAAAGRQDGPVVIAVDAIDEATDEHGSPGTNRLSLPRQLPDNVFIVVTSRGRNAYELDADRIHHVEIEDDSEANEADLLLYVDTFIGENAQRMEGILRSAEQQGVDFAEVFLERSEGNFLYASRVLPEIANGSLPGLGTISDLPLGLREYYQRHWATMQAADPELFEELHRPVIQGFAVLHETTAEAIAETWALPADRVLRAVATWREFLNQARSAEGSPRYRIYHKSFLDFLQTTAGITAMEQQLLGFVDGAIDWDDE